jgi:replicative DNA helicase
MTTNTEPLPTKAPDENDRLKAGTLPEDPTEDTVRVARGPRLLTVQQLLIGSQKRATSPKKQGVITTGNWRIDRHTGGIQPGHGWILAAETSWGKTAFALSVADENLKLGKVVLIVATEDDESIYGDRLLARRSGVEASRIRDHKLDAVDHQKIALVVQKGEKTPIYLDARDIPEKELCEQIAAMVREYQVALVIVDYLQTIPASKTYQDERVRFRETAQRITHTCKSSKTPLILCSQITPDETNKMPGKYRVRESKDVVNAAEAVLMGFELQSDWTDPKNPDHHFTAGTKCINIDKAKVGTKGVVALNWNQRTANFDAEYQRDHAHDYLDQYRDPEDAPSISDAAMTDDDFDVPFPNERPRDGY